MNSNGRCKAERHSPCATSLSALSLCCASDSYSSLSHFLLNSVAFCGTTPVLCSESHHCSEGREITLNDIVNVMLSPANYNYHLNLYVMCVIISAWSCIPRNVTQLWSLGKVWESSSRILVIMAHNILFCITIIMIILSDLLLKFFKIWEISYLFFFFGDATHLGSGMLRPSSCVWVHAAPHCLGCNTCGSVVSTSPVHCLNLALSCPRWSQGVQLASLQAWPHTTTGCTVTHRHS